MLRKEKFFILFRSFSSMKGIGEKTSKILEKFLGPCLVFVLWHRPRTVIDRRLTPLFSKDLLGQVVTLKVCVKDHIGEKYSKGIYRIRVESMEKQSLTLVFFKASRPYLLKIFPLGQWKIVSGKLDSYQEEYQMIHPQKIGSLHEERDICVLETVYPKVVGLKQSVLQKCIQEALQGLPHMQEWIAPCVLQKYAWLSFKESLVSLHSPQSLEDLRGDGAVLSRLAYDEVLLYYYTLGMLRCYSKTKQGHRYACKGDYHRSLEKMLPFSLTEDQTKALQDIQKDLKSSQQMVRVLQGDVGSGKTIVGFCALLYVIEEGKQGVLMAPTQILAQQHYVTLKGWCEGLGITLLLFTAALKGSKRQEALLKIQNHQVDLIVGTHAVYQTSVIFSDLGLAVIDEQHRFGVNQRLCLLQKGNTVECLMMSATPIPRTLLMSYYGDVDVSILGQKPQGRKKINTYAVPFEKGSQLFKIIQGVLDRKEQVYWICPLVQTSQYVPLKSVEERLKSLEEQFPHQVACVHGQMESVEKNNQMESFLYGKKAILVATTVVEVGVNVPKATLIVIEHAEHFGLSQLHQLRGRVGRSDLQSICVLFYQTQGLLKEAQERLRIMRSQEDGFFIAHQDLLLRGGGEFMGEKQSGEENFYFLCWSTHHALLDTALQQAAKILKEDPFLRQENNQGFRDLLTLYQKDNILDVWGGQ